MSGNPRVALFAILSVALSWGAAYSQDETALNLTCKGPLGRGRLKMLRFDGSGPLPDNAVLKLTVQATAEQWSNDRLDPMMLGTEGNVTQVKNRKFDLETPVNGPGLYSVRVELIDEFQNPQLQVSIKGKYAPRAWSFKFHAWGDDLAEELWPKLQEVDALIAEAQIILRKFELACQTEQTWQAQAKALTEENGKLLQQFEKARELKALFPAAMHQAFYTVRNVQGTAEYFIWKEGTFAGGKSYHADNEEVKTFRNEAFTYANLRRYVDEALAIAGRELCLWILKDARRAGEIRPQHLDLLKNAKAHAGVAEFVEPMTAMKFEELDAMEKTVRTAKLGTAAAPPKK
jgi:hypothetical protein